MNSVLFRVFRGQKYSHGLSLVEEDDQILGVAGGGDDVDFAVGDQVGGFDVFDGDFL